MVVTGDILNRISRTPYTFLMFGTHAQVFTGVCVFVCVCVCVCVLVCMCVWIHATILRLRIEINTLEMKYKQNEMQTHNIYCPQNSV